jgi:hypothetical protein
MENLPQDFQDLINWYSQTPERAKKFDEICERNKTKEKVIPPTNTEIKCIEIISANTNKDGEVF